MIFIFIIFHSINHAANRKKKHLIVKKKTINEKKRQFSLKKNIILVNFYSLIF